MAMFMLSNFTVGVPTIADSTCELYSQLVTIRIYEVLSLRKLLPCMDKDIL